MIKGIDISHHQGNVDFIKVKTSGIKFVIIREGYRNTVDSRFFEYVKGAKKAGLSILGIYHFSYALDPEEAKKEAQKCIDNMKKAGIGKDVKVFYDFEYDTVKKANQKGVFLGITECNKHTVAFCEEVKRLGYTPGIYTNLDYYKHWYTKDTLSKYCVWLADYTGKPDVNCTFHQYSNTGHVNGITGNVDLDYFYGEEFKMEEKSMRSRFNVVTLANSWLGKNESDGSYKSIIDVYNSFSGPLPRGIRMNYDWSWCACTWSALAIALGYTDIMPIEISCGELIKNAKRMGCWKENDGYVPLPGDAILYDWSDNGKGDNIGWPDHVGVIDYVNKDSGYMTIVEGNYKNSVKKRTISINGRYIRGFISPKYDDDKIVQIVDPIKSSKDIITVAREAIAGQWGNGSQRKELLNDPAKEPSNKEFRSFRTTCFAKNKKDTYAGTYITTANVYCRNDAGTNKKALCQIPKDTEVKCYGYYTRFNGVDWLLIEFILGHDTYVGFTSSKCLKKK